MCYQSRDPASWWITQKFFFLKYSQKSSNSHLSVHTFNQLQNPGTPRWSPFVLLSSRVWNCSNLSVNLVLSAGSRGLENSQSAAARVAKVCLCHNLWLYIQWLNVSTSSDDGTQLINLIEFADLPSSQQRRVGDLAEKNKTNVSQRPLDSSEKCIPRNSVTPSNPPPNHLFFLLLLLFVSLCRS